ncbi:MAG: type II secretion system GspH family protein [Akkermansiaceae bacterium]|jgi:prepilin-type N-terminal cleavage/methylation domain-containing protein|nr:type II secretion system GspH family protein [Akkermansiaceae bacterium]
MKRRGFTLVEILIVLAVVATLAGIGVPVVRAALAKSREAACLGKLRSLGVALEGYLQDHNQIMPVLAIGRSSRSDETPVLETVLLPYIEDPDAFRCPQDKREFAKSGSSYFWNHLQSGLPVTKLSFFGIDDRPDRIPLISDKEAWHPSGTNFLYADQSSSNKVRFGATN